MGRVPVCRLGHRASDVVELEPDMGLASRRVSGIARNVANLLRPFHRPSHLVTRCAAEREKKHQGYTAPSDSRHHRHFQRQRALSSFTILARRPAELPHRESPTVPRQGGPPTPIMSQILRRRDRPMGLAPFFAYSPQRVFDLY
jgi:hypothetical protein